MKRHPQKSILPDSGNYQIGKYGRMRRNYLKEHHKVLYAHYSDYPCTVVKFYFEFSSVSATKRSKSL